MINGKTRASLIALVAAYLLYTVYGLFQESEDTTMAPAVRILFIVFFSVAAVGLLVYAYSVWKNSDKKDQEDASKDDKNSLK